MAKQLCDKLGGEVTDFFLPKDFDCYCKGCTACFIKEASCPDYERLKPLTEALDNADVIILASPVYVMHATGAMKSFLDHYGYRYMVHRPEEKMFSKQAVCISTAAGAGMRSTIKDMADSTFFWGCARTYKLGIAVMETRWEMVKPTIKTRVFFGIMSMVQKNGFNEADVNYWKAKGWTNGKKPWKK